MIVYRVTSVEKAEKILKEGFRHGCSDYDKHEPGEPFRVHFTDRKHLKKWIRIIAYELELKVVAILKVIFSKRFIGTYPGNQKVRLMYQTAVLFGKMWDWADQIVWDSDSPDDVLGNTEDVKISLFRIIRVKDLEALTTLETVSEDCLLSQANSESGILVSLEI